MICFHFTIFVVLETTVITYVLVPECCDLLSFYYLCRTRNNKVRGDSSRPAVVICFHFTIFVVLETTLVDAIHTAQRCDLLSFYYLCRTRNNDKALIDRAWKVVICFHFTIFVVLETTNISAGIPYRCCDLLSFYYLCRTRNNLFQNYILRLYSCDLLSFYYLCRTRNNKQVCRKL